MEAGRAVSSLDKATAGKKELVDAPRTKRHDIDRIGERACRVEVLRAEEVVEERKYRIAGAHPRVAIRPCGQQCRGQNQDYRSAIYPARAGALPRHEISEIEHERRDPYQS